MVSTAGALLTNDSITGRLRTRDDGKREAQKYRTARAAAAAARRLQREADAPEKNSQKALEEEQKLLQNLLLATRPPRTGSLDASRATRLQKARLQAVWTAAASVSPLSENGRNSI
ncbi:hypothetical protein FGB62_89g18 [Gracilaria domingensis]|nr:hypothetical protein FGB62_89g18 [Gracilaria domingensis]